MSPGGGADQEQSGREMTVVESKGKEEEEERNSSVEYGQVEIISNAEGGVRRSRQLPYVRMVLCWKVGLALVGGSVVYGLERDARGPSWFHCVYAATNCATATGLSSFDILRLRTASLVVLAVLMQLGAATLISLVPVVLRIAALEAALPRQMGEQESAAEDSRSLARRWLEGRAQSRKLVTFDLRKYRLVPEWLVEYKALCFLLRVALAYHLAVYLTYGAVLAALVAYQPAARRDARAQLHASPVAWAAFTVISSFNNVGFSLQAGSFESLSDQPLALFACGMLVLHGNVLYPACLRWIIVGLSARAAKDSNRKVYFRYLLLHGRKLYSHLFSSQATWLLVATQLALISAQIAVTLLVSRNDKGFRDRSGALRLDIAAFEAVNTRHAGFTAVDLAHLHGGTLLLQMAMMWLAPVPLVAALRSSSQPTQHRAASLAAPSTASLDERDRRHASGRRITVALGAGPLDAEGRPRLSSETACEPPSHEVPDAMVDTRALLLERYPDRSPPWTERVTTRLEAFAYHCKRAARNAYAAAGFHRDAALIFFAWFLIAVLQNFRATRADDTCDNTQGLFYTAFELASAFGNVGLSLGSIKAPTANASFSMDLNTPSLLILILVQLFARTRDMPRRIDSSLTLPTFSGIDLLRATVVTSHGRALQLDDAANNRAPSSAHPSVDNPALTAPLQPASPAADQPATSFV